MPAVNDVELNLRKSTRVCYGGELLEGRVSVDVENHCRCRSVEVEVYWYTTGMGSQDQGSASTKSVYQGELERRTNYDWDFSMELPPGPYTYEGELLNVRWVVEATVDIYDDPLHRAKHEIRLEPGDSDEFKLGGSLGAVNHYTPGARYEGNAGEESQLDKEVKFALPVFLAGIGLLFFLLVKNLFMAASSGEQIGMNIIWLAMGLLLSGLGGSVLYSISHEFLGSDKPLRRLNMNITPNNLSPGDSATAELQVYASKGMRIQQIKCTCRGYERVIEAQVDQSQEVEESIRKKLRHEEVLEPNDPTARKLSGGEVAEYYFEFEVPDDAPFTFYGQDNQIIWELETNLTLKAAPNVVQIVPFLVRPKIPI